MALVAATLGTELANMVPTDEEQDAIDRFAAAFETYFGDAMAGPIPITGGSLAGATSAMKAALVGMSQANQGAAKIQAGIVAFWGIVASASASIFAASVASVPPPGLAGIAAALTATFAANVSGSLNLNDAANAIAAAIHGTQAGGVCNFPVPPGGIGPQPIA